MAKLITFNDPKFAQIKYDSGERILLSNADSGIAIFRMRFFGLIPGQPIANWPPFAMPSFVSKFAIQIEDDRSQFRQVVDTLLTFTSIVELERFLAKKN